MPFTTIDDPSKYFQVTTYTGTGSNTQQVTNGGNSNLQPDWLWVKNRSNAIAHGLWDSSRGASARINLDNQAEESQSNVASFDSDGFTMGATGDIIGTNTHTYVAWQWKANGGTTTTNDASSTSIGSQDSVYQANTTAGFSIVTWSGANAVATMAHGLGAVPHLIILKGRGGTENWGVYHHKNTSAPETDRLKWDTNDATADSTDVTNDTAPTSTLFTVGNSGIANESGNTYFAYLFSEKKGYSKFGSYVGSGENNGIFVFTGFQPAFVMIKRTDSSTNGNWWIHDTERHTSSNPSSRTLKADTTAAEVNSSDQYLDILSNGFKTRNGNNSQNGSGNSYVYVAFAEKPFVSSSGVPTTAR